MRNLERQFEGWRSAFGESLTREEYFEQLRNLAETGNAVKRVLNHLQSKK